MRNARSNAFAAVTLLALLTSACSVQPRQAYPGPRLPPDQVALVTFDWTNVAMRHFAVDGGEIRGFHNAVEVLPGEHRVALELRWSNGRWEGVDLPLAAQAGQKYTVRCDETWPAPPPRAPERLGGSELLAAGVDGAVAGAAGTVAAYTAPLWIGPVLIHAAMKPPPDHPPAGHRLDVWIEQDGRHLAEWSYQAPPPSPSPPKRKPVKG